MAQCISARFCSQRLAAGPAQAAFPDKPIRFVVPFPAGGGNEITARALAEGMTKDLGQQVVIEIKPGAGTIVGTEYALTRPADGYTILMASFSHTVNPSLKPSLPYDPAKVGYVALVGRFANSVVIPLDRPFKTMPELIAHARANPGKLQLRLVRHRHLAASLPGDVEGDGQARYHSMCLTRARHPRWSICSAAGST